MKLGLVGGWWRGRGERKNLGFADGGAAVRVAVEVAGGECGTAVGGRCCHFADGGKCGRSGGRGAVGDADWRRHAVRVRGSLGMAEIMSKQEVADMHGARAGAGTWR